MMAFTVLSPLMTIEVFNPTSTLDRELAVGVTTVLVYLFLTGLCILTSVILNTVTWKMGLAIFLAPIVVLAIETPTFIKLLGMLVVAIVAAGLFLLSVKRFLKGQ